MGNCNLITNRSCAYNVRSIAELVKKYCPTTAHKALLGFPLGIYIVLVLIIHQIELIYIIALIELNGFMRYE